MEIQAKCDNVILDDFIQFDVGGTMFKTRTSTLHSVPGSLLASLDKNPHTVDRSGNMYSFDRDATIFRHILNAHREGEIHVPRDICPIMFKKEMQYWGVPLAMLAPCCWKQFYSTVDDTKTLVKIFKQEKLTEFRNQIGITDCKDYTAFKRDITKSRDKNGESRKTEIKHTNNLWLILEEPASSLTAKVWCFFYLAVVVFSVVVFIMLDYESVRVGPYLGQNNINMDYFSLTEENITYILATRKINRKLFLLATSDPHPTLFAMDAACVFFFIIETIVHFSVCPRKRTYLKNQYNVIKIFLSMSMIIAFTIEFQTNDAIEHRILGYSYLAFKSINILRLFLLFRLRKLYSGLHILLLAVEQSMQELILLCLAFSIGITVYGSLMYSAEITTEAFPNVLVSMWWALITMSTIGYGDFVPTCTAGYIVGSLCAVSGLIVISMVISAVAAKFSGLYSRNSDLEMHRDALQEEHKCIKFNIKQSNCAQW